MKQRIPMFLPLNSFYNSPLLQCALLKKCNFKNALPRLYIWRLCSKFQRTVKVFQIFHHDYITMLKHPILIRQWACKHRHARHSIVTGMSFFLARSFASISDNGKQHVKALQKGGRTLDKTETQRHWFRRQVKTHV